METKNLQSMNQMIRRGSGANRYLFRYAAMVFVLLMLGVGNAWAGHDQHTATLNVAKGTGNGSVYASTSATATSGSASASFNCGKSSDGQHTGTLYAYATPADGYTFLGWTTSASSSAGADNANPKGVAFDVTNGSSTQNLYAHFVEKAKVNITFEAPSNGTYTIAVNGGSAETVSSANVVKSNVTGVTLTATPASGYAFAGWYKLNSAGEFVEDLSIASPYDAAFTKSETIKMGARFVPTTLGKFILKGSSTEYYGLKAATVAAGGSGTIVPVAEETVVDGSDLLPFDNGTYSIKAGATLLVPHTADNKMQLEPDVVTTAETLYAYRTLVLKDGVNIVCNGNICLGGKIMSAGGGSKSAYVTGPCGVINMANGGHIELNSGAKLYCWGFIKGQDMDQGNNTVGVGTITAHSGAIIKEDFSVGDWRGGTATYAIYNKQNDWKLFPFQSYSIQNVEVPTTYEYGSTLNTFVVVNGGGGDNPADFDIAGSSNTLFLLKDAQSTVRKWYDPTTDLTCYELSGTAKLDALNIEVYISVSSSDYYLPISNSMHIILKNCNMTLSKPMTMQAGSVIEIKEDATANLESRLHMFDKDEWGKYIHDYYFRSFNNLTSHKNRGAENSNEGLEDAKIIVDGTLNVVSGKGYLYSTNGGANIMGNGGGKVVFGGALPSSTTLHHVTVGTKAQSYIVDAPNDIAAANLCNEDGSYTKSIASKTFLNIHGRWFNQTDGASAINADHTYNFTYIASGAVSGTGGTDVSPNTHNAVYAPDKTGLVAGMKWCNVVQDGTCSNIFNATQTLNETPASDIRYTYPSDSWLQLLRTETEGVYGGSDNNLYAQDGCTISSLGSVDENCLYTINDVKKALVDGHFVALEKNTEDEAWHDVANPTNYYISFAGCTWHPATKYAGEEKAYIVEEGDYIWYNNDWLLVEREDPFFFDYNDQNVKRYYEYEDGAWVLASPRVRVQDAIETRDFYTMPEAITVASGKKNATITILKDISGINTEMTYTAKNTTCTLNLNGHTVSGACAKLLTINASGSTFTITDNTTEKNGRLENIFAQNAVTYNVTVTAGTLNIPYGTIHAENPAQYASKAATVDNVAVTALTACGARAVQVAAAQKLNINGGRLEAFATRNAFGIVASGNNANTTQVTITDGEIYAEAPCCAYAINCLGKLNVSGGLIEAKLNDHLVNASFVATDATNNIKAHTTCYGIYMQGGANKAATSCYFGTLTMTGGTVKATSDVAADYTSNVFGINLYADFAGTGAANTKATDGTLSQKYAAKATIENAKIEVNTKANYGYGIIGYGRYNSADKSTSVIKIKNTEVDVYARTYAYGILSSCRISTGTGNGGCTNADIELTNCDVYSETTVGASAYAIWSSATQGAVYEYTYKDGVATATNSIYAGEYAIGANMTVHSGRYEAKSKTSSAYASGTSTKQINTYSRHSSTALYQQLGGQVEAYSTLNIEDGTFIATAGTETARAVSNGGNTTITGGTFQATATTRYAYCIYAISGTLNVSNATITATSNSNTANGIHLEGTVASYTMFAYAPTATLTNLNVTATTGSSTTARALYVAGKTLTQTEAQKEALTSTNRNNYYNIYQVGEKAIAPTVTVQGGTYKAIAGTGTAYGALSEKTTVSTNKVETASPEMTLKNATFIAQTGTSTTAYGVQAGGPTLIEGCTIEATAKTTTASGVRALDKTTTIKNSTITATATDAAYGLEGYVEISATHGYCWHGEFDLSDAGTTAVTAEAKTKAKTSYAIFLNATKKAIASGNFAGDYATAANATINGGTYVAKFNTSGSAYVISLGAKQTQGSVVAQPEVEVLDGFFNGATAEVGTAGVVGHMQLKGGYFVHPTNLATYAVAPKSVWTLPNAHEHYNPYKYKVTEHYTITFKNGTTQLQQNDLEAGSIPAYTSTPTKDADAQYTYTFDGWSTTDGGDKLASLPAVSADATYFAHYSKAERKYTVNVSAGEHGSVSPASVSGIGCETASADITATPDAGYTFNGWTLPDGVTAADGYTVASNPIRIHAIAADKTITANFVPRTDINYTVKHWQQNLDNNEYTEYESEGKTGTTATATAAAAKSYTGFTAQSFEQGTIAGNGSTIVNIYYNRNTFTITWLDGNGNAVETDENVKYGATPEYNGTTPTKTATAQYSYTFNNTWLPALAPVAGNETYTAQFSQTTNQYTLNVVANDAEMGTVSGSGTYDYNTSVSIAASPNPGFKFVEWNDHNTNASREVTVTADVTYTATFDYDIANYTVKHWQQNISDDGYTEVTVDREERSGTIGEQTAAEAKTYTGFTAKPIEQQTIGVSGTVVNIYYDRQTFTITWEAKYSDQQVAYKEETLRYGAMPSYGPEDPFKEQDDEYTYEFLGWTPTPYAVTKNQDYIGTFNGIARTYDVTWNNADGTLIQKEEDAYTWGVQPTFKGSNPTYSDGDPTKVYIFRGWKYGRTGVEYKKDAVLPGVAGDETYTAVYTQMTAPIDVENGETETISSNTTTPTTTVHVGGTLNVAAGKALTTTTFILEASADASGQISETGTIEADFVYYDLKLNSPRRHWHAFGVPWAVDINTNPLVEVDEEGKVVRTLTLGNDYDIIWYNTETRASSGPGAHCWEYVAHHDKKLTPGQGYMIAFTRDVQTVRFVKADGAPILYDQAVTVSGVGEGNNQGINALANPMAYHATLNAGPAVGYVHDGGEIGSDGYEEYDIEGKSYVVGRTVYIQVRSNTTVAIAQSNADPINKVYAPARRKAVTDKEYLSLNDYYRVSISGATADGGSVYVLPEEGKEDKYVVGHDLAKFGMSTKKAQIWIRRYDANLGLNTIAPENGEAEFPINLYAPTTSEYTIANAFSPDDEYTVYLTRDGEAIWNLTDSPYTLTLNKGTVNGYGIRLTKKAPQIATGVDEAVVDAKGETRKVIINDKVFIIRGDQVYSADGQLVK